MFREAGTKAFNARTERPVLLVRSVQRAITPRR
jgi:hypothetical protein